MANMSKKTQKRISRIKRHIHQTYGGYGRTEEFTIYERLVPENIREKHEEWVISRYIHCKSSCIRYHRYMRYQ